MKKLDTWRPGNRIFRWGIWGMPSPDTVMSPRNKERAMRRVMRGEDAGVSDI